MSARLETGVPGSTGAAAPPLEGARRGGSPARRLATLAGRGAAALWLCAGLVAAWWFGSAGSHSPYFPPLSKILTDLDKLWIFHDASTQLVPSMERFIVGYVVAAVAGIALGALFWRVRTVHEAVSPLVYFLYVLPAPALVPAAILFFGIGDAMKMAIIAFAAVWPVLLNTIDGTRGVDAVKLDSARTMGMSPRRTLWEVVLPGAMPQIAAGLRAGLQVAILLMVVSEMVASTSGIGFFILNAQQSFAITDMWTGIIVLGVVGSVLNLMFVALERWVLRWHYGERALQANR